jgi:L-lysine 6-transaminase
VRGKGLLTAFDFPDKAIRDRFINSGLEDRVMFLGCGSKSILFRPALIIEKNHIDEGLTILEKIASNL